MRFLRTILAWALFLAMVSAWLPAQISPGVLSTPHQMLDGAAHCSDCHAVGKGPGALLCSGCHQDIARRIEEKQGFHGAIFSDPALSRDACARCHSDHNGRDFQLIRWDRPVAQFDHRETGYWLEGRHAQLDCRKCHNSKNISAEQAAGISVKDLNRTYLGLSRDCLSCHPDEHRGQLSSNCRKCHDSRSFKKANVFVHALTTYPLTGAHEKLDCAKCHKTVQDRRPFIRYTGLSHDNCTPCHDDKHRGAFATTRCITCHTLTAWKPVREGSGFDHSRADFPLHGKHRALSCRACHPDSDFKRGVAFKRCSDCHRKDPHAGQFRTAGRDPDCSHCHTVEGFKPAVYDAKKHADTRFPLDGKHARTLCAKCHPPLGPQTVYKIDGSRCLNCHKEGHPDAPSGDLAGAACEKCHSVNGFVPSTFPLTKHASTRFPLSGAHSAVICAECHRKGSPDADSAPSARSRLHLGNPACSECHTDPHLGQFLQVVGRNGGNGAPGCASCHTTSSWTDLAGFDHARTDFELQGAHRIIPCVSCHRSLDFKSSLRNVIFGSAPRLCSQCHQDRHGGQFQVELREKNCADCHGLIGWRPALFDHDTNTSYKLTGAHVEVPCALCHPGSLETDGRAARLYKPTPRECGDCHSGGKTE